MNNGNKLFSIIGLAIVIVGAYLFLQKFYLTKDPTAHALLAPVHATAIATATKPATSYNVNVKPTITAQKIDEILCAAQSPACGTGGDLYNLGVQYNVDPAFALAFFYHESHYGTQGEAQKTLSLGNIRCENGYACVDGYASFSSWQQGYKAWYELIAGPLYVGKGLSTIDAIIPIYAPPGDHNDDSAYIHSVESFIDSLRGAAQ